MALATKPFSVTGRSLDGRAIVKIYRGVQPMARRDREWHALQLAARLGLSVPDALASGLTHSNAWIVMRTVFGAPGSIGTEGDVESFIERVRLTSGLLREHAEDLEPGPGWLPASGHRSRANSESLLDQLSSRCRQRPWWTGLESAVRPLDQEPVVYLHGDFKPEHFMDDGEELHVIDWEASARGPAQCDYADAVFHVLRDLAYEGDASRRLPIKVMSSLPVSGGVLAWRLVRWLDRRRPLDIDLITSRDIHDLAGTSTSTAGIRQLACLLGRFRSKGVPR
ncbi:aminoglycoside phosphotransferase family protein [Streptomyces sp. MS1.AVA.3]|uniref:aminoglycoside phosphotransferase family protein n=1 Tax=Streptomyces decoyicus TaxID=249567 RepID=UPI0030C1BD88